MDILQLDYWNTLSKPEAWASLMAGLATAGATLIAVIVAAWLTHRYNKKHHQHSLQLAHNIDQLKREMDALEAVWQLLAQMGDGENAQTLLLWRKPPKLDEYHCFIYPRVERFLMHDLPQVFYQQKAGLYLPSDIKTTLFDYAGSWYGLYFRYKQRMSVADDEQRHAEIRIDNPKLVEKFQKQAELLREQLQQARAQRYAQLTPTIQAK